MSRIDHSSLLGHTTAQCSRAQIELDAASYSFSGQATDSSSLAALSMVSFSGRFAKMAVGASLRSMPFAALSANFASLATEAATMTGLSARNSDQGFLHAFTSHLVDFTAFRIAGSALHSQHALGRQLGQSLAMMMGHQATRFAGLEQHSSQSWMQQFLDANISTLQIHSGSLITSRLGAHKLEKLNSHGPLTEASGLRQAARRLAFMSAGEPPSDRRVRQATDVLARVASGRESPIPVEVDYQKFLTEFNDFHDKVSFFRNFCSNAQRHGLFLSDLEASAYELHACHYTICGRHNGVLTTVQTRKGQEPILNMEGILAERMNFFSTCIQSFEASGKHAAEKLNGLRESLCNDYDNLQLLHESMRILGRDAPDELKIFYHAILRAYDGLHNRTAAQTERVRNITRGKTQISDDHIRNWTDRFLVQVNNAHLALNAQILRGRIPFIRGEHIGGSFYDAFELARSSATFPTPYFVGVKACYDTTTGLLVGFKDNSLVSSTTLTRLRQRGHRLQEVVFWVDTVEGGNICNVQFAHAPTSTSIFEALNGLLGLQILPRQRVIARLDPFDPSQGEFDVSFQWNMTSKPAEEIYRIVHDPEDFPTEDGRHLIKLQIWNASLAIPEGQQPHELWIDRVDYDEINYSPLIKLVRRQNP